MTILLLFQTQNPLQHSLYTSCHPLNVASLSSILALPNQTKLHNKHTTRDHTFLSQTPLHHKPPNQISSYTE